MADTDFRESLVAMIDKLLDGRWTLAEFEEGFYWYFHDQIPERLLPPADLELFIRVAEKLDRSQERTPVRPSHRAAEIRSWLDRERRRL